MTNEQALRQYVEENMSFLYLKNPEDELIDYCIQWNDVCEEYIKTHLDILESESDNTLMVIGDCEMKQLVTALDTSSIGKVTLHTMKPSEFVETYSELFDTDDLD